MGSAWRLPLLKNDRLEFGDPTEEGLAYLADNLRPGDQEEAFATFGHRRYMDAIRLSLAGSDSAVMAFSAYGEPVALIGVTTVSLLYNVGCPWALATPLAEAYRRAFIDCGRAYTRAMLEQYQTLTNHVDVRNTKSVAWLQRIGYRIGPPEPYGELAMTFLPFRIER